MAQGTDRTRRFRYQVAALASVCVLISCAAGNEKFTHEDPAGFFAGLWHGMIALIAFVVSLFSDSVQLYERNNSGPLYDLGFLMGVLCIWGGGSSARARRRARAQEERWDKIANDVETRIKRRIREWSDAEPGEDWQLVEDKAEAKLKRKLRAWVETE